MAKYCPLLNHNVTYLDCLDCDEKVCVKETRNSSSNKNFNKSNNENNHKKNIGVTNDCFD